LAISSGFETEGDIKVDFNPIPASATDQVMIGLNLNANSALPVGLSLRLDPPLLPASRQTAITTRLPLPSSTVWETGMI
jgi:hypothetical protein